MKKKLHIIFLLMVSISIHTAFAQGWVAEVEININHGLYAYEKLTNASVTISGVTVSGSSTTSIIRLILKGPGTPVGAMQILAGGVAWEPYDRNDVYSASINASYTGDYRTDCTVVYFDSYDGTDPQHISGSVIVYPRLFISDFIQDCDKLTLKSNTCSSSFIWEISESSSGGYKLIPGKSTASLTLTRKELYDIGMSNPFGRKYFRVTGTPGTTSGIQIIDIAYPGPTASIKSTSPKCYNQNDGSIDIEISSSSPSIDDFVFTLYSKNENSKPAQYSLNNTSTLSIANLAPGNYWVNITNNSNIDYYGSCWTDLTVDPLINPDKISVSSFTASDYNGFAIKCKGESNGTIQANPTGGTGTYTAYVWTPAISTTHTAINLPENTYKIKVMDSNNCWSDEYSKTLTAPDQLTINLQSIGGSGGYDVSCLEKKDGIIVPSISGGAPGYSYAWPDGSVKETLSSVGPGTYTVVVSDQNECTTRNSLTLTAPAAINFTIEELSNIKCPAGSTGILEVQSVLNTIGPINYLWSTGETSKSITDKPAGNYAVTIKDDQGCSATGSKILTEPKPYIVEILTASDFNGSPVKCPGEANGKLITVIKDGDTNVTDAQYYTWYQNGNIFSAGPSQSSLDNLPAGLYKVDVQYNHECQVEKTFVLSQPEPIVLNIEVLTSYNGSPISCFGSSDGGMSVSASGGTGDEFSYQWNTGFMDQTVLNQPAGNYTVVATDINGCKGTVERTLKQPGELKSKITVLSNYNGQPLSCFDASDAHIKASARGGTGVYNYSWSNGQNEPDLINIKAGAHTLTTRDLNGCTSMADTTIINPLPVSALIANVSNYNGFGVSCKSSNDGFIEMSGTGGTGIYEFSWNATSFTGPLYKGLNAGNYVVMVRDMNGCSSIKEILLTEPPILSVAVANVKEISCHDGDDGEIHLSAEGGGGGYQYSTDGLSWQTSPVLTGLKARPYDLYVRDMNGCEQIKPQALAEPLELSISFDNIQPAFCNEARGEATAIVSGGTGGYLYEWKDSQHNVLSTIPQASSLSPGIYTLLVTDENFCEIENSLGISAMDGPKVKIDNIIPATCSYASDGRARLDITEESGPYTIHWPDGQNTLEANLLAKGNYLVEIIDKNKCKVVESVTIPAPDSLLIGLVGKIEPLCHADCNGSIEVLAAGGAGDYNYMWADYSGPEYTNLCAGTYEVRVKDLNGCMAKATFILSEPAPIDIALRVAKSPDCYEGCDGSLEIEASGGTTQIKYLWSNGKTESFISNLCAGSYSITVQDSNECILKETFTLENPQPAALELGGSITLCAGQSHLLNPGTQWVNYYWKSNTGFNSSSQTVTIADAGIYWLEATDYKGCMASDTFILKTTTDLLKANFFLTTQAMVNDTVVAIDVSWPLPDHVLWNFPAEMNVLENYGDIVYGNFRTPGVYEVTLTAMLGQCRDQIMKTITVLKNDSEKDDEGRLSHEAFVKEFSLYPNPNEGIFDVEIEFLEESPIMLSVWNTLTATKIGHVADSGKKSYLKHFDLGPLSAGPYSLRLDYIKGTKYIRFIVR